jgi:hypothetical protein
MAEAFQRRVTADLKGLHAVRAVLSSISREIAAARIAEASVLAEAGGQLLDNLSGLENAEFDFAAMRAMIGSKED